MNGNIKMRIKGILYTGKTVYECLCKAVRETINIHAKMVDVNKLVKDKAWEVHNGKSDIKHY